MERLFAFGSSKPLSRTAFRGTRRLGFSGIASAIRWVKTFEETERTEALPTGGDRRSVLKPHRGWLLELRRKENDLTLDAIAERLLRSHGVEADKSMLSRFFAAEGISFKKNRARQRTGSSRRR
jgi:transposase